MSAYLRIYGTEFDPDRFCSESGLTPFYLYRRGEPVPSLPPNLRPSGLNLFRRGEPPVPIIPERREHERSGINVVVSKADYHEFSRQVDEATAFLEAHKEVLLRLRCFPGIEVMSLDFGITRRDVIVQSDLLPPPLIRLAGELGLGIELSQYPVR